MRRFVKFKALFLVALLTAAVLSVLPSVARIGNFPLPGWVTETFESKFKLGLDLQGGLHLEYSVAVDEAMHSQFDRVAIELEAAFREKKNVEVKAERHGDDELWIKFAKPEKIGTATKDVMGIAYSSELTEASEEPGVPGKDEGVIRLQMRSEDVQKSRKSIVSQALDTVRRRVDVLGIAEPSIYPKNRSIVIELPGLTNASTELKAAGLKAAKKVGELVRAGGGQARTRENADVPGSFRVTVPEGDALATLSKTFGEKFAENVLADDRVGGEFSVTLASDDNKSAVILELTDESREQILKESSDFRRLLHVIEKAALLEMHMVDDETPFRDTGKPYLRALLEGGQVPPGVGFSVNQGRDYGKQDQPGAHFVKAPIYFLAKSRDTLEQYFDGLPTQWQPPNGLKISYEKVLIPLRRNAEPEDFWRTHVLTARPDITGDRIVAAKVQPDPQTGAPKVSVTFDSIGADLFGTMSGENVGRKMAIVMDDVVTSDPEFNEAIPNGQVQITLGSGSTQSIRQQANDLVKVLKSGSLPARLTKEFEIRVGADLGKESVERGFEALVLGLGLVIIFMAIYYRRSGLIAVFALLQNMVLILAVMAFFKATLTLPGLAGMVLTIGMAVDANVIIFERIREFLREGHTARAAIQAGYDRAFTTILDSQLTTAIAGLVLWQYGSGPIRGFAITLLIGICTSIFTGVWTTRVFFDWQSNRKGYDKVSI